MTGRLYTRIALHFLGLLALGVLGTSSVFVHSWRRLEGRPPPGQAHLSRLARHCANLLAEGFSNPTQRKELASTLASDLELVVTVRDAGGRILESGEGPAADRVASAPIRARSGGPLLGTVEVAPRPRARDRGLARPLYTIAIVVLLVGLGALPLAWRISRPVERLTEASRRLGAGDLAYRIPPGALARRDELAELVVAWNDMANRIETLVEGQQELLTNVSHDLRAPLARVRMGLALLPRDDDKSAARLRSVLDDLDEVDRLIEDLLTTARLGSGAFQLEPALVDVQQLLAEVAARARKHPALAGKTVTIDAPTPLELLGDVSLLRRALWNLIENAGKYGAAPIVLHARQQGRWLQLVVTDAGPGIPAEERERVIEAFVRGDSARTPGAQGGFGLGLTLVRRIARVHEGEVRLEPARVDADGEHGLAVILDLPLEEREA